MSDLAEIKAWWATLTDTGERPFLAVSAPDEDRAESSYVHEDAIEEADELGLDIETLSYAGWFWHSQELAFVDDTMRGPLYIHFGGDRERIREALETVPAGFVVGGGETDRQTFWIKRPSKLDELDITSEEAAETAQGLVRGEWEGEPEERRWLHEFVQHPEADSVARFSVLTQMGFAKDLGEDDMRAWVRDGFPYEEAVDEASSRAAQFVEFGGREIVAPVVEEWMRDDPDEIDGELLAMWGDERSREILEGRIEGGTALDLHHYLTHRAGADEDRFLEASLELGEERPELRPMIAGAHTTHLSRPEALGRSAEIMENTELPDWLRLGMIEASETQGPHGTFAVFERQFAGRGLAYGLHREEAEALKARWLRAAESLPEALEEG